MLIASAQDFQPTIRRNIQVQFLKDFWADGDAPHSIHFHQSETVTFKILEEYSKHAHGLVEGIGWVHHIDLAAYNILPTCPSARDVLVLRERYWSRRF